MDLLDLRAKVSLDTSEYEKGVREVKKSADEIEKSYDDIDKSASDSGKAAEKGAKKVKDAFSEMGDSAEKAANKTESSWDGAVKSFKDMQSQFSTMVDTFKGLALVKGIQAVAGAVNNLIESTEEYRVAQGKLNTAFEVAGYSADVAQEAYQGLYGIIGDTDTAVEAAQLMAKLSDSVEDFSAWTDIAAGVAGTFGDALPINSLMEAANETVRVGEVTGVLADALNWAGVSEDDFNAALADCTDEAERNKLTMDALTAIYSDATDAFHENNQEVIAARENQTKLDDAMADLGSSVSDLKNGLLVGLTPAISTAASETADFIDDLVEANNQIFQLLQNLPKIPNVGVGATGNALSIGLGLGLQLRGAEEEQGPFGSGRGDYLSSKVSQEYAAARAGNLGIGKTALETSVEAAVTQGIPDAAKKSSEDVLEIIKAAGAAADEETKKAAEKTTTTAKKTTEKQKTLYEQLTEQYKTTYSGLSAELSNSETEYQIWAETVGDSVSEADKLQKQLESLNEQHSIQEEAVKAAQEAYDAYAASEGASEEEATALYNTVLKQKLALAQLQTEIDGTAQAYDEATNKAKQYADALEEGMSAASDLGGSLSTLGGVIEDLGETTENDGISSFGEFLSTLGGGISTILSVISAVQSLTGALQTLSSVSGTVNALGGIGGAVTAAGGAAAGGGAAAAGAAGAGAALIPTLAIGGAAIGGAYAGVSTVKDVVETWKDESKSTGEKLVESAGEILWGLSPIGGITNLVSDLFGSKKSSDESTASAASYSTSYTAPATTTTTTGNGVTVIQNIYSEAKTSAELMREARYEQERAVLMA